jgi:hypothetical protein
MDRSAATIDPRIIIGYLGDGVTPIYQVAGASDDDDDDPGIDLDGGNDADELDEDEDDPDDEPAAGGDEGKPAPKPTAPAGPTQADIDALKAAQAKRNREHREKLRALQAQLTEAKKASQKPGDGDDERTQAIADAVAAERQRWQRELVNERAEKELIKAGLYIPAGDDGKRLRRLLRTIDYDSIEFEDGKIYGIDEQVEDLKADYPELFRDPESENKNQEKAAPKIRAPKADPAGKNGQPPAPKTTGERYAAMIRGGS